MSLVELFVVVGLDEAVHPSSEIRANVESEGRICEICSVCPKLEGARTDAGWTTVHKTPSGRNASVNFRGLLPEDVFLSYRTGCEDPITDLVVIYLDRFESIPEGYAAVCPFGKRGDYDITQKDPNSTERQVVLCYSRTAHKLPICNVIVLRKDKDAVPEGYEIIDKSLNIRSFGKDLFIAFIRAPQVCFTAKPTILQQFPPTCAIPGGDVSLFCMPTGVNIAHHYGPPLPTFFSFCLTVSEGKKMYGCCVTFHEAMQQPPTAAYTARDGYSVGLYVPKCVCLLSYWPFFDAFREFLVLLFTLSQGPNVVPIERRLYEVLYNTPVPAFGSATRISLESHIIDFVRPKTMEFPLLDASMMPLFRCLDIENVLLLFKVMLLEHKIVLHSKNKSLLLPVAETLAAIMFPFRYQHVFIPVMPTALSEYLEAPVPYLIGMPTNEMSDLNDNRLQVTLVDLDANKVTLGTAIEMPDLPHFEQDVLRRELQICASIYVPDDPDLENADLALAGGGLLDRGMHTANGEPFDSRQVRAAFLRFFLSILKDYRCCLRLPFLTPDFEPIANPSQSELFDHTQFLEMHPLASHSFIQSLIETQCFMRFVEERTFPSTRAWEFVFFDQCINDGVQPPLPERRRVHEVQSPADSGGDGGGGDGGCGGGCGGAFEYTPFILRDELFNDGDGGGAAPATVDGGGAEGHTCSCVVSLDSTRMEGPTQPSPAVCKLEDVEAATNQLSQKLHAAWFLLYGSYVRRVAEKESQRAAAAAPPTKGMQRDDRLAALQASKDASRSLRELSSREGLELGVQIVNRMHDEGTETDEACFRALMEICAHSKLADDAKKIFEDMVNNEIVPDTISYNAFVEAVVREEDDLSAHLDCGPASAYGCFARGTDTGPSGATSLSIRTRGDPELLDQGHDAMILAGWACTACSYEEWASSYEEWAGLSGAPGTAASSVHLEVRLAEGTVEEYPYISPLTLFDEVEALLAHWGDDLVTFQTGGEATDAQSANEEVRLLKLRSEHPTVFWNCIWYFDSHDLPTFFLHNSPVSTLHTAPLSAAGSQVDVLGLMGLSGVGEIVRKAQGLILLSRFAKK